MIVRVVVLLTAIQAARGAYDPWRALLPVDGGSVAERHLAEKLAFWQNRLQLQEWKIAIQISKPYQLRPETVGNIKWDPEKKTAVIRVLDAAEYNAPFEEALKDMEFTVVHELIHLTLSRLSRMDQEKADEEQAINHLTDALLNRNGKK